MVCVILNCLACKAIQVIENYMLFLDSVLNLNSSRLILFQYSEFHIIYFSTISLDIHYLVAQILLYVHHLIQFLVFSQSK